MTNKKNENAKKNIQSPSRIGSIDTSVISALNLNTPAGTPVYIGQSNIDHMKRRHPADYAKYGADIPSIIQNPDYVGLNTADDSIEYVKEYVVDGEFVKVAVRVSMSNKYFIRSLYVLNKNRVNNFINKGTLKKV